METHETGWWMAFSEGDLTVQSCSSCDRRQFPTGPVCRHCHASVGLKPALAAEESRVCATTVVTTPAAEALLEAVPFVFSTFEASDGLRMTLPVCRLDQESCETVPNPFTVASSLRTLSAHDVVQIAPCRCGSLLIPHVLVRWEECQT